jgi:hypothetical protein
MTPPAPPPNPNDRAPPGSNQNKENQPDMKLTRPALEPAGAAAAPAHVLHWVPGYLNSDGLGGWELQDTAAYDAGEPGGSGPKLNVPRDTAAAGIAPWVAALLGYPVQLDPDSTRIVTASLRPLSVHIGTEPLYYVRPATGQEDPR